MLIVTKQLDTVKNVDVLNKEFLPSKIKIIADTEFTQDEKMIIDMVGLYSPNLNSDNCYCFLYEELTEDFNPITKILELNGYKVDFADEESLSELLNELALTFENLIEDVTNPREIKKLYDESINNGYFDELLTQYNIDSSYLQYKREHKESNVFIVPPKINIELEFFFAIADLFKIWGKKYQHLILKSQLNQYRVVKVDKPISIYAYVNGVLYEFSLILKDSFYRIPPLSDRSLNGNAKALGLEASKLDIKNNDVADQLGLQSAKDVMSNISRLRLMNPELLAKYNAQDIFLSNLVSETQQLLLDKLRNDFGLSNRNIADTTGSTVAKFILDLLFSHFNISEEDKDNTKFIRELLSLTKIKNLQEIPLNDFGIQPFLTVGGLLFTRTAKYPVITGKLSDCDLSSCYASFMSEMNIYLGEPVTRTFKYKKYKPTLREVIEFVNSQNLYRDAWFVRVSGELETAFNTLVMSDLRFVEKSILCPTVKDLKPTKKSVEQFNAFKTPKKQAVSTLLLKQIKFGLINADILDCLKLLPESWYEEYLNLKCDCLVYFPTELIGKSLSEIQAIRETLPDEAYLENFDPKSGIKGITTQYYKNNAALKFDIGHYWRELKAKRKVYKKDKNPVQEIFKLVGNSGYGVLACLHLVTNNLIASNAITAGARSAAWLMTNALNGFAPITDGTSFNWNCVPIGLKFKELVSSNPCYLFDFDPNIKSNLTDNDINNWLNGSELNNNFQQHLYNFYGIDEKHIPANRYGFELKSERFTDKNNLNIDTVFFTSYYNTNAGNYSKGMNDCKLLIDATDYDFNEQNNYVKARSFQGKDDILINWYINSVGKKYESPTIYSENKVIKFGDGNTLAIRLLESGECNHIAHPMGFSTIGYKMMKLISRSQFLFMNESQLQNFETNEIKLSEISNYIFNKKFWENLKNEDLLEYDVTLNHEINYFKFSRTHAVGIGFELLALSRSHKGSIESVRKEIFEKIYNYCSDFNAGLHISRNFKLAEKFKYLLAAIIVLKANAEHQLIECLKASADEPTILSVSKDNIYTLNEIWMAED